MNFKDITTEEAPIYTLNANEECVFFLLNKDAELTFELAGENSKAYIFALYLDDTSTRNIHITQTHSAHHTLSQAIVRSVLGGDAGLNYKGLIHIDPSGNHSSAIQESRALLLSPEARHSAIPSLEILPRDVICHHKASASPLNQESLYYLMSRGLNKEASTRMLINGFLETTFEQMSDLGVDADELQSVRQTTLDSLFTLYA
jgi:Fe-S cluster assembly protein SufD